jgi:hypothetical protein
MEGMVGLAKEGGAMSHNSVSPTTVGMTVWVQVLGYPQVLNPMGVGSSSFLHPWVEPESEPGSHRTRFRCGFRFSPAGAPEP